MYYSICRIASLTGCRVGELQALEIVDIKKDRIIINKTWDSKNHIDTDTKTTSSRREVPIFKEAIYIFDRLCKNRIGGKVFSKNGITPISNSAIQNNLYSAFEKIGINEKERKERNLVFHSFRHYFCSYLANNGVSSFDIKTLSGHSQVSMVEHYSHSDFESSYEKVRSLF